MPAKACTITASFKKNNYTITFKASTGGSVNRSSQSVPYGSAITTSTNTITMNGVTTTATPSTGYQFSSWTNDCGSTVTKACTITANFAKNNYTVTINAGTGGSVSKTSQSTPFASAISTSSNKVTVNGTTITATAATGYSFSSWTNNCGATMPAKVCTITANFGSQSLKQLSYMQDVNTGTCTATPNGTTATLTDKRDGSTYTVAKISGVCTMTQNLRLSGGRTLTPADSNVTQNYSLPSIELKGNKETLAAPQLTIDTSNVSYGGYYNYCAATAGTICMSVSASGATDEASQDICPKGWKLPHRDEYNPIINGSTTNKATFNPIDAGWYLYGSQSAGTYGFYWLSTAYSIGNRYSLYYDSNVNSLTTVSYDRGHGFSVRCVLK